MKRPRKANEELEDLRKQFVSELTLTANDIDTYLRADVPLECYRSDIGRKLQDLIDKINAGKLGSD